MPDYIYLLENRLSADQQNALRHLRDAAREAETLVFLTGDAVRDLTSGHAVRDIEVTVHGNSLKLKKKIEKLGAAVWGEDDTLRSLYLCFPGTVRVDLVSAHRVEYPKPGKLVIHPASIQEDLRRRDFTVNAMAISLNEGSYGLLMDPLNGAADIEGRTLRLVSSYGFLEDPSTLLRATRYIARLGWEMDPRTRARYDNAKNEGVIEHLSDQARSQELEQIGHEEEGLKVLRAMEAEGWMKVLFPAWTSAGADEERLKALHDLALELLLEGVHADMSAAQMRLLTAKLSSRDLAALKKAMLRPGFVEEWNSLDALAAKFAKVLLAKENTAPSASFKLFTSYDPEAVLWLGFTSKDKGVQERYHQFRKVWPEARQRIPHALMLEMRITPELPVYREVVHAIFLQLIDGKLSTPEELRAFLEPYSPPAPPPRETVKRTRARRSAEAKLREAEYEEEEESEGALAEAEDLEELGEEEEIDLGIGMPKDDMDVEMVAENEPVEEELVGEEEEQLEPAEAVVRPRSRKETQREPAKKAETPAATPAKPEKPAKQAAAPKAEKPAKAGAPAERAAKPAAKPALTTPKHTQPEAKAKPAQKPAPKPAKVQVASGAKKAAPAAGKTPAKAAPKAEKLAAGKAKQAAGTAKAGKAAPVAKPSKPPMKKTPSKPAKKR
ncbi:MAG: CCA tRNA nucleotidyltransferase [Acidobacteriota bacterium]